mmetsp:Transcript_13328/g.31530  ORF Transcript_13328/g.31530 Transcript_13328/m.31530 type:complete len:233 (+) Transcript_13328:1679-2377(+)
MAGMGGKAGRRRRQSFGSGLRTWSKRTKRRRRKRVVKPSRARPKRRGRRGRSTPRPRSRWRPGPKPRPRRRPRPSGRRARRGRGGRARGGGWRRGGRRRRGGLRRWRGGRGSTWSGPSPRPRLGGESRRKSGGGRSSRSTCSGRSWSRTPRPGGGCRPWSTRSFGDSPSSTTWGRPPRAWRPPRGGRLRTGAGAAAAACGVFCSGPRRAARRWGRATQGNGERAQAPADGAF